MRAEQRLAREMAGVATAAGTVEMRADALLELLSTAVPYSAGWIGVRDPETRRHHRVGSDGDTDALARYFARPEADDEVERMGLNRIQPPMPASGLPVPQAETLAWADYLLPAGFADGVAMALFTRDGRHLGFMSLLTGDRRDWTASYGALLTHIRPILATALDRLPSLAAAADLTGDALGGVVLTRADGVVGVPGLPGHPLLTPGSATLAAARHYARAPGTVTDFLSPWGEGVLRVTVLDCRDEGTDHLTCLVLVRPVEEDTQLRESELRLLGALLEGWSEERVAAATGVPDPRGRARVLARRLGLHSTGALLRHAARQGLHLPPLVWR